MNLKKKKLQYKSVTELIGRLVPTWCKENDEIELARIKNDDVEVMIAMKQLHDLVANGEAWLRCRVIHYATERKYIHHTAGLGDDWRISISGLSQLLLFALTVHDTAPQLVADDDYSKDPIASFGILAARRHRQRGVKLGTFLGLMKYYRQSYMDLIFESDAGAEKKALYSRFVNRFFDRMEIGFCEDWNTISNNEVVAELQANNRSLADDLKERVKELNCMYGISLLVEQPNITLVDIIQGIADIMRSAWQYPEITCVEIVLKDQRGQTSNLRKTPWRQVSPVMGSREPLGFVAVYYLEEKPEIDEGPFLKEERCLIDAVATRLGRIIERKTALEALCESEKKLRYLYSQFMADQENERKRIAMELHDDLGQCLMFLKIRVQSLKNNLTTGSNTVGNEIEHLLQLVQEILEKVRNLSHGLVPSFLDDLGLRVSIESLAKRFAENTRILIPLNLDDIDCLFSPLTEVFIYRIFQEALTNIKKHSHANQVSIAARKDKESVAFTLEDDGAGCDFDLRAANGSNTTGIGLISIKERVKMLKGDFMLETVRHRGTRLSFSVPIEKKTARPDRLLLYGL